jgi:hypothetical protein
MWGVYFQYFGNGEGDAARIGYVARFSALERLNRTLIIHMRPNPKPTNDTGRVSVTYKRFPEL